jgi:osmotically-inducible protein OsmY
MRRFFLGMAIASLTAGAPMTAFGGDREIADAIITQLKQQQSSGSLKGFDINLSVEDGKVTVDGAVATQAQLDAILRVASSTQGVTQVIDNVTVQRKEEPATPKATEPKPAESPSTAPQTVMPASANDDVPSLLIQPEPVEPTVRPEDANITSEILSRLGTAQKAGQLRNFDIDISTIDGEVWVRGQVASADQKGLVLGTVQRVPGVLRVIDEVALGQTVRPVGNYTSTTTTAPQPLQTPSSMPVVGSGTPRAFAPSSVVNGSVQAMPTSAPAPQAVPAMAPAPQGVPALGPAPQVGYGAPVAPQAGYGAPAAPVPMQGGPSYGGGVPRYDQPSMPSYAWPSYAAYPNYSAVTYPKQYSASAWPYIGPFYPYPQVPLGWRKVALEWDDGLWYLDFTHK